MNEILVGILGSAAYEIICKIGAKLFGLKNDSLMKEFYNICNKAVEIFYMKYKDQYGTPNSSFLSNEKNWELIIKSCLFYGSDTLSIEQFYIDGFGLDRHTMQSAVKDFITILTKQLKESQKFDQILAEKDHIKASKDSAEKLNTIEHALNNLVQQNLRTMNNSDENHQNYKLRMVFALE